MVGLMAPGPIRFHMFKLGTALLAFVLLSACGTLPQRPADISVSHRLPEQRAAVAGINLTGQRFDTGVKLLDDPTEALAARLALADEARSTIDVQYYIWADDAAGRTIFNRVVAAADRGVRVRLLIDDIHFVGEDQSVLAYHAHPNIDIRAFNPFRVRQRFAPLRQFLDLVTSAARINHRMHNKAFVVDNTLAVVGGRNLSDAYYGLDTDHGYRDIDVLLAGRAVDDVSKSFDDYWNSPWALPIDSLTKPSRRSQTVPLASPTELDETALGVNDYLPEVLGKLIWARVEFISDAPTKADGEPAASLIAPRLQQIAEDAQREVLIENAYFIPAREELTLPSDMPQVDFKILTNSLASNDSGISHAGYKRYRKRLLKAGAQLFELRPDAAIRDQFTLSPQPVTQVHLHSKVAIFDDAIAFVGSFNLDPRSRNINTEMGVVVYDREFARRLAQVVREGMSTANSWQLKLDQRSRLRWFDGTASKGEPKAGLGKRMTAAILSWLPVESLL